MGGSPKSEKREKGEMIKDLKNSYEFVRAVLRDHPETRDNDLLLVLGVWKRQGLKLTDEQRDFLVGYCFTPESISRNRRFVQEKKEYLGSSETGRLFEEEKVRSWAHG